MELNKNKDRVVRRYMSQKEDTYKDVKKKKKALKGANEEIKK